MSKEVAKKLILLLYFILLVLVYFDQVGDFAGLLVIPSLLLLFIVADWNPISLIYGIIACLFCIPFLPNLHPPTYSGDPTAINALGRYAFYLIIIYLVAEALKWKREEKKGLKSKIAIVVVLLSLLILFYNKYWNPATISINALNKNTTLSLVEEGGKFKRHLGAISVRRSKEYKETTNDYDSKHYVNFVMFIKQNISPNQDNLACVAFNVSEKIDRLRGDLAIDILKDVSFKKSGNSLPDQSGKNQFDWEIIELDGLVQRHLTGTTLFDIYRFPRLPLKQFWPQRKILLLCFLPQFKVEKTQTLIIPADITFGREIREY